MGQQSPRYELPRGPLALDSHCDGQRGVTLHRRHHACRLVTFITRHSARRVDHLRHIQKRDDAHLTLTKASGRCDSSPNVAGSTTDTLGLMLTAPGGA